MTYGLLGKIYAQPGERDALVAALLAAAQLLEGDATCIHYVISTSDEPEAVWVSEVWTEADAHDASLARPEIRGLIERVRPLVAGMSDQTQLHVHGGKGVEKITK
jgi:quinol monooxygenase YgiN